MAQDIALGSDFSVFLDHRNDLAQVEGQEAFEQSVVITLTDLMQDTLSNYDPDIIKQKLRQQVTRTARQHGEIETIDQLNIRRKPGAPDRFVVDITYLTDADAFTTEVSP